MSIAIIGCGDWGKNLVRVFYKSKLLTAVCDKDEKKLKAITERYHVEPFADYEELLQTNIKAVIIATPAFTHYEIARRSLLADKDVFVEKPLALDYHEGAELVRLAEEKKRILMVGHILEYHPAVEKMKAMIEEGKVGWINYIYSSRLNRGKVRKEENVLWSFAPHDIFLILSIMGELPQKTSVRGGAYISEKIMDVTVTHFEFSEGAKAHIFVSWLHPYKEQRFVVIGSKGMLVFDDLAENKLMFFPEKEEAVPIKVKETEPLEAECQHFIESIATRKPPRTDGKSALQVLEILTNSGERRYFIHETSFVDNDVEVGGGTKIWHFCHISEGAKIGKNCTLGQNVFVGRNVRIGNNVKLQNNVSVFEGVTLEDDVFVGPSAVFTNVLNPRSTISRKDEFKKILVKRGATIGANATVVCGNTIGEYAFIGAGAVVTRDVPEYALVYGIPATVKGYLNARGEKTGD